MRSWRSRFGFVALLVASIADAHGPTPQKIDESIQINADPKTVWAIAGDFARIAQWDPDVKASSGSNASRELTFANGQTLTEEVDEYDAANMSYSYRMIHPNLDAVPASSYAAKLVVTAGDNGGSVVRWYGRAYRGDTGNEPAENLNDEAARTALSTLFKAGLAGIKAKAERHP